MDVDDPPGFVEWLEEQAFRQREDEAVRCPTCGSAFGWPVGVYITKTKKRSWWVCPEPTCGQAWQMKRGQMVRKPESDAPVCTDKECCP